MQKNKGLFSLIISWLLFFYFLTEAKWCEHAAPIAWVALSAAAIVVQMRGPDGHSRSSDRILECIYLVGWHDNYHCFVIRVCCGYNRGIYINFLLNLLYRPIYVYYLELFINFLNLWIYIFLMKIGCFRFMGNFC